jgi:hypothetical protein
MGYKLPIVQHEYTQYANRMLKAGKSPFFLPPVAKISMEKPLKDHKNRKRLDFEGADEPSNVVSRTSMQQSPVNRTVNHQLISKITGKGRHVNEAI